MKKITHCLYGLSANKLLALKTNLQKSFHLVIITYEIGVVILTCYYY